MRGTAQVGRAPVCVCNTDSHPWVTLRVLPSPKSTSLLPENLTLYKNMTVSLENNSVAFFFNKTWKVEKWYIKIW